MTVLASSAHVSFYINESISASSRSSSVSSIDPAEVKQELENGDDNRRISAMHRILSSMVNGDPSAHSLLMHIIRFVVPSKNKTLKKLLLLYLENVNKRDSEGKLRQEMILVWYYYYHYYDHLTSEFFSNALRNDLQHPNEYVRGATLRFLCKVKEVELLEPLTAAVRQCLDHRHPYVRRNAILAVNAMFRSFDFLFPDAPELIYGKFLGGSEAAESDPLCLRNALAMLTHCNPDLVTQFLFDRLHQLSTYHDSEVQLVLLEHLRRNYESFGDSLESIYRQFLHSPHPSIKYDAACSVVKLLQVDRTRSDEIVCDVLRSLSSMISSSESDDNCRLIALEKIEELLNEWPDALDNDDAVLNILKALSSSDLQVRRKALGVVLRGIDGSRGEDILLQLERELTKLSSMTNDSSQKEYRELLLDNVNVLCSRFFDLSSIGLSIFLEYLMGGCDHYSDQVTQYVKDIIERSPVLRQEALPEILKSLSGPCGSDKETEARRTIGTIWIAGEFAKSTEDMEMVMASFEKGIGDIASSGRGDASASPQHAAEQSQMTEPKSKVKVLADGTYATESSISAPSFLPTDPDSSDPVIKTLLRKGYFEVGAVMSVTIAKILSQLPSSSNSHRLKARGMLLMTGVVRFGLSRSPEKAIDRDSYDRVMFCLRSLNSPATISQLRSMFVACREAFETAQRPSPFASADYSAPGSSIDSPISFSILSKTAASCPSSASKFNHPDSDLEEAINGEGSSASSSLESMNMLSRVVQLTGFSDPVYAETYVNMHQSDIFLDILLVNQLEETLQDVSLDLVVSGDLKVIESPPSHMFGPLSFVALKAVVKICSTCNGSIYGSINFGISGEEQSVLLLPIVVDVLDFVRPESISDSAFRSQWTLLEWENKINVDVTRFSTCSSVYDFIAERMRLKKVGQNPVDSSYLAGNLYAKTIFGEEILVNTCLEKSGERINGHLRLRSRSQGVAIALGDRILTLLKPLKS